MHHIQQSILDTLNHYEYRKFGQLRVKDIDSNLFTYHLKQLVRDGYIEKEEIGYTLSAKGIFHVDRFSKRLSAIRLQPKIITMIDLRNELNESLVVKRKYQPFINKISFPSGKLHLGETVAQSGDREMYEKTGISNVTLQHKGDMYLTTYRRDEMVGQYLAHVLQGVCQKSEINLADYNNPRKFAGDSTPTENENQRWSDPFWAIVATLEEQTLMPGLQDMRTAIDAEKQFFFKEFTYRY